MRRHAKALFAVLVVMLALGATAAFALQTHPSGTPFEGASTPNKTFWDLGGMEVDRSTGKLYIVDPAAPPSFLGVVHRFKADGSYDDFSVQGETTSPQLSNPKDVAVDASGNFYLTDTGNGLIDAFDPSGAPLLSFDGDGKLDGSGLPAPFTSFSGPCGVAVDQVSGNLFVADQGNNRVWIFKANGEYLGKVADSALNGPCGIALTSTGDLYVRNGNSDGRVLRFNRASATEYDFASVLYAPDNGTPADEADDGPRASDVAVSTADDHVYVDMRDRITEYDSSGSPVSVFGQGVLSSSASLAVDSSTGRIYAADGTRVRTFGPLSTLPDVITRAATDLTPTSATLKGSIDPAGEPGASCQFEYGTDQSYGQTVPCSPAGPYDSPREVSAAIGGLSAGTEYHCRLIGSNPNGSNAGKDTTFTTIGPPLLSDVSISGIDTTSAILETAINPGGAATTYRVEYVDEAEYQANGFTNAAKAPVPDASIPTGNVAQAVSQSLTGLDPDTEYRARFSATNSFATATTPAKTFETFATPAPSQGQFPGQGFLPHDRTWEMVSTPNKNGADITPESSRTRAAADGSAVNFLSLGSFAGVKGITAGTDYLAQRSTDPTPGSNGWTTHGISPEIPSLSFYLITGNLEPRYEGAFSDDLEQGVFFGVGSLTGDPYTKDGLNLFRRNDLRAAGDGSYDLLTACPLCEAEEEPLPPLSLEPEGTFSLEEIKPIVVGNSPDFDHVAFESVENLTEDPSWVAATYRLYEWDRGTVRLVGRVPTSPATFCDDVNGPACEATTRSSAGPRPPRNTLSPHTVSDGSDGHSRVFFTVPGTEGDSIYARIDGTETVQLNASEREVPSGFAGARFLDATPDGTRAFFSTVGIELTDEPANGEGNLYVYDADTPNDETQRLTVNATAGQFKLAFGAETTNDIASDASPATVEAELNALSSVGGVGGSVSVTGGPGDGDGTSPYTIVFGGSLSGADQSLMATLPGTVPLSGGTATAIVTPWAKGGGHLTLLNADGEPADDGKFTAFAGSSEDGRRLYFTANGQLVKGEPTLGPDTMGIYLWEDGEVRFVGASHDESAKMIGELATSGESLSGARRQGRVTPDGRHLLFGAIDGSNLTGYDHGSCPEEQLGHLVRPCRELYLYSADTDTLQCASCNPTGAPATVSATTMIRTHAGGAQGTANITRALSDDGSYVFFSSAERLVPEDTNGTSDAYVFDAATGEPRLLSSGEDKNPSYYVDASADGSNAFFLTRERLSGWDFDNNMDLYDARIGGGFPEPPPADPGCQGDACQPPPLALNDPTPGSASFAGPGDPSVKAKKAKKKGRKAQRKRNQKQRQAKRKRAANHDRRASR